MSNYVTTWASPVGSSNSFPDYVRLVAADGSGAGAATVLEPTSTARVGIDFRGHSPVSVSNGTATAVCEIMSPTARSLLRSVAFGVVVAYRLLRGVRPNVECTLVRAAEQWQHVERHSSGSWYDGWIFQRNALATVR